MRSSALRFAVEAAFLILVALVLWRAHLGAAAIIIFMLLAWFLTAILEGLAWRGWQGAATFVPPLRPMALLRAPREPEPPAWQPELTVPEEVAPSWLESAEVLGVHVSGFEPALDDEWPVRPEGESGAVETPDEKPVLQAEPEVAEPVAETEPEVAEPVPETEPVAEPEPESQPEPEPESEPEPEPAVDQAGAAPVAQTRRVGRSRLPRRFVTQSGRARTAVPEPQPEPDAAPEEDAEAPKPAVRRREVAEPESRTLSPIDRRWPWRKIGRVGAERDREYSQDKAQDELPLFETAERDCRTCGRPISKERLRAIPTATQCIECKRAGRADVAGIPDFDTPEPVQAPVEGLAAEPLPEPISEPAPEPMPEPRPEPVLELTPERVPEPVPELTPQRVPGRRAAHVARAGEWNVWELEKLARSFGGGDAARDQEWAFLLVYLREFANPEGILPTDFDALVRESFPELVAASEAT